MTHVITHIQPYQNKYIYLRLSPFWLKYLVFPPTHIRMPGLEGRLACLLRPTAIAGVPFVPQLS